MHITIALFTFLQGTDEKRLQKICLSLLNSMAISSREKTGAMLPCSYATLASLACRKQPDEVLGKLVKQDVKQLNEQE
jgi:hypothetical protein